MASEVDKNRAFVKGKEEGYDYRGGSVLNPYPDGSDQAKAWDCGFKMGRMEAKQDKQWNTSVDRLTELMGPWI